MKIEVKNLKYLFFYRSLIGKLFKYYTKNPKYKKIVNALNIKSRKKRIIYVYKEA